MSGIKWEHVAILFASFVAATVAGGIGWLQRSRRRSFFGCLVAAANCGVFGLGLAVSTIATSDPKEVEFRSFLAAFGLSLVSGWAMGRMGFEKVGYVIGSVQSFIEHMTKWKKPPSGD